MRVLSTQEAQHVSGGFFNLFSCFGGSSSYSYSYPKTSYSSGSCYSQPTYSSGGSCQTGGCVPAPTPAPAPTTGGCDILSGATSLCGTLTSAVTSCFTGLFSCFMPCW